MFPSWKPPFLDLRRQVEEMFEELIYRRWAITAPPCWRPALDLHDLRDAYLVEIELPDVAPEDVQIQVSARTLTLSGQRRAAVLEGSVAVRSERVYGAFHRAVDFPEAIDAARAEAECRHGTYRIRLPKKRPQEGAADVAPLTPEGAIYVIPVTVREPAFRERS